MKMIITMNIMKMNMMTMPTKVTAITVLRMRITTTTIEVKSRGHLGEEAALKRLMMNTTKRTSIITRRMNLSRIIDIQEDRMTLAEG